MIERFRRYPEYRDSGVEWLGEIPAHWGVRRLKAIASIRYGLGQPPRESKHGLPLIRATNIDNGRIVQTDLIHVDPSDVPVSRKPFLKRSEIIVVRSGAYTADSAIVREPYVGAVAGYDMVVSVVGADPEFIAIALLSKHVRQDQLIAASTRSAQPHLNAEELGSAVLALPPGPEQIAIAHFLDRQTGAIDRLVRKKERLIELLDEERASLISHAVTRGLDPEVPTRDSGVEWLGEIPAHWEVVELGRVGAFFKGKGGTKLDEKGQGIPCVRYGDLYTYHDHHILNARSRLDEQVAEAYTPIAYGDVLFAASGETIEEIGTSAVNLIRSAAVCGGDVIVFRPADNWDPCFLGYALGSANVSQQKATMGRGFTVAHIYITQLKRLHTPLPPLPEQRAIADFLNRETGKIDAVVAKTRKAIERLREYRDSVISAAVTGQIDVRESIPYH